MNKLKFIYDLSIKYKIIVIILSITFLIHSIGFTFITIWDINRIKSEIQTGLALNTKIVANNCVVPLTFGDDQQATEALSHLKNIEFIETACLFDKHGKLFANYPDTLIRNSILTFQEQQENMFKDGFFYVKELVFYQNEMYGTLFIKANSKPLKTAKRNIILTLILLSIVLDTLVIILAIKMQKYVSSPILKLKHHFDKITENQDFSIQLTKQNNDEIGSLYDGFNKLLNRINKGQQERDKSEEALQESEAKYRRVSDNSPAVLYQFLMAPDGEVSFPYVSDMAQDIIGISPDELMKDSSKFFDMVYPEDLEMFNKSVMASAESLESFPIIFRWMKDGEEIWIEVRGTPTPLTEGGIIWDGYLLDITERKHGETELKRHKEHLEELVNERTKNLEEKNKELEDMNDVFVNREYRIKELKDRLKKIENKSTNK